MPKFPLKLYFFDELPSTQLYAKNHLDDFHLNELSCIVTKKQTEGIGTHGRKWIAKSEKSLTATFVFFSEIPPTAIPQLAEVTSVCVAKILEKLGLKPTIKWPNDILVSGKKIAGILVQIERPAVLIGIGLNVLLEKDELASLDNLATSIFLETNKKHHVPEILSLIAEQLQLSLELFFKHGFDAFFSDYDRLMIYKNTQVEFLHNGTKTLGIISRVLPHGSLEVILPNQKKLEITSGHLIIER